jgi:hypothetical protein
MGAGVATKRKTAAVTSFASADEMRDVLTRLLTEIEDSKDLGNRLRSAHASYRYVFPDVGLALNVISADAGEKCVRWSFDEMPDWKPTVTLEMSSEVANRYLQGRENLAIAIARGMIRASCDVHAALNLLPISNQLSACYRQVLERDYPHLLLA